MLKTTTYFDKFFVVFVFYRKSYFGQQKMSRNTNSVERQNTYVYMLRVKLVVNFCS